MLAMERLPLSQLPFSCHMSLGAHSPRQGIPAPQTQGLPSPPALHGSHHGPVSAHTVIHRVRPESNSSLSSVHTPPPYGDSTMMGSAGPAVYSPTHSSSLHPPSSADHQEQLSRASGLNPGLHGITLPSFVGMIGQSSLPIMSSAQETSCNLGRESSVTSSREHQSSSPAGKFIARELQPKK